VFYPVGSTGLFAPSEINFAPPPPKIGLRLPEIVFALPEKKNLDKTLFTTKVSHSRIQLTIEVNDKQ
jgi:hypothetical protein